MLNKIKGWQKVYAFTLQQVLKSKTTIFSMVLFCLISLASVPLTMHFAYPSKTEEADAAKDSSADKDGKGVIRELWIYNETELPLEEFLDITKMDRDRYETPADTKVTYKTDSFDEAEAALKEKSVEGLMLLRVAYEAGQFKLTGVYGATDQALMSAEVRGMTRGVADLLPVQVLDYLGITPEQKAYATESVDMEVVDWSPESGVDKDKPSSLGSFGYSFSMIFMVFSVMLVSMCSEQVATSVVQEKSSKVVELLLTTLHPLALLLGKVLAIFTTVLIQLALMVVCVILSGLINVSVLHATGDAGDMLNLLFSAQNTASQMAADASVSFQFLNLVPAVLIILLGTLFYATLAGILGASVSKMEDLQEGLKVYSLILVIGAYLGLGVAMFDMMGSANDTFRMIAYYFPLSSMFITPGYLVIGKITLTEGLISVGFMVAGVILIMIFAAGVYENLIYHNGEPVKIKNILAMAFSKKQAKAGDDHKEAV